MNTVTDNFLAAYEKVIYIAFGCGCVQTYRDEQMAEQRCATHGDAMVSSNQEYLKRRSAA